MRIFKKVTVAIAFLLGIAVQGGSPLPADAANYRVVGAPSACYDPRTDAELDTDRAHLAQAIPRNVAPGSRGSLEARRSQLIESLSPLVSQWITSYNTCMDLYQRGADHQARCPNGTVSTDISYINACNSEGDRLDQEYQNYEDRHNAISPGWRSWNAEYHSYEIDRVAASSSALLQARTAAASEESANCIFSGTNGCQGPVALIAVSPGTPSVPVDAAAFIRSIPKGLLTNPGVARDVALYERSAHVRGEIENELVAARTEAKTHPDDPKSKLRIMAISGRLNASVKDEHEAKKTLSFYVNEIKTKNP